jgi:hypothetical protein
MKTSSVILIVCLFIGCKQNKQDLNQNEMKKILFLHHSTGYNVWIGKTNKYVYKLTRKGDVKKYFDNYNKKNKTDYVITEQFFPKGAPYGWKNYPYDYYNIWVKNSGENPYMDESTLEILTKKYDVIIFKHCFPVSNILEDTGTPDINSEERRVENYKLQYNALKNKMREFPDSKFIVWTPAVHVKNVITEGEALRTQEFYNWIVNEWDEKGDNIFIWDFYKYETEGSLYLLDQYVEEPDNSHPNREFSARLSPLFGKYIIDVIQGIEQ